MSWGDFERSSVCGSSGGSGEYVLRVPPESFDHVSVSLRHFMRLGLEYPLSYMAAIELGGIGSVCSMNGLRTTM